MLSSQKMGVFHMDQVNYLGVTSRVLTKVSETEEIVSLKPILWKIFCQIITHACYKSLTPHKNFPWSHIRMLSVKVSWTAAAWVTFFLMSLYIIIMNHSKTSEQRRHQKLLGFFYSWNSVISWFCSRVKFTWFKCRQILSGFRQTFVLNTPS